MHSLKYVEKVRHIYIDGTKVRSRPGIFQFGRAGAISPSILMLDKFSIIGFSKYKTNYIDEYSAEFILRNNRWE